MKAGKQLSQPLRFVYGVLKAYIGVSVIYMTVALVVIFFDTEPFNLYIVRYIKTEEFSKLTIPLFGYLLMLLNGFLELIKFKKEKRKNRRRRKKDE
ncbi:MAG: hypothetical protein AB2421_17425 [Thermotaleaceae bacterium]